MMLSIITLFVFSSLIALIYGLIHSYKTLTQLQFDEEGDEHLVCSQTANNSEPSTMSSQSSRTIVGATSLLEETDLDQFEPLLSNKLIIAEDISRCHCFIDIQTAGTRILPHHMPISQHTTITDVVENQCSTQNVLSKDTNQLYQAHHSLSSPILSRISDIYFEETDRLISHGIQSAKFPSNNNDNNIDNITTTQVVCNYSLLDDEIEKKILNDATITFNNDPYNNRKQQQLTNINVVENPITNESIIFANSNSSPSNKTRNNKHNKLQEINCFDNNKEYHL